MWASLFASAVSDYQARHAVYIDILKKLSSNNAMFLLRLRRRMDKSATYADVYESPDLWNSVDKRDAAAALKEKFALIAPQLLDWQESAASRTDPVDGLIIGCLADISWRADIIPLAFDLAFHRGTVRSVTNSIAKNSVANNVASLIAIGVMEKFEISASPDARKKVRTEITCSVAILNSLGFDFIATCLPSHSLKKRKQRG